VSKILAALLVSASLALPTAAVAAPVGIKGPNPAAPGQNKPPKNNVGTCVSTAQHAVNTARKAGDAVALAEAQADKTACQPVE
jgi:hypothetical protein